MSNDDARAAAERDLARRTLDSSPDDLRACDLARALLAALDREAAARQQGLRDAENALHTLNRKQTDPKVQRGIDLAIQTLLKETHQ